MRARRRFALAIPFAVLLVTASPASAAGRTISGHVQGPSGEAVTSCKVELVATGGAHLQGPQNLDSNGDYAFTDLQEGTYVVEFRDCFPYLDEFWDDKATLGTATPITLSDPDASVEADATLAEGGKISGRVTDAGGAPLAGICVSAVVPDAGIDIQVTTDANGDYAIRGLSPAQYKLAFNACGPPDPTYFEQWYDNVGSISQASPITVGANAELTGKNASLVKKASISGRITDGQGNPLPNICVGAVGTGVGDGDATTDANGDYILAGLPADTYRLVFSPCHESDSNVIGEVYNDHPGNNLGDADPISLAEGQTITGVNASLTVGGSISGHITDESGNPARACLMVNPVGSSLTIAQAGSNAATGEFNVPRLPPGDMSLLIRSCDSDHVVFGQSRTVHVSSGAVTTADFTVERAAGISGRVTDTSGNPINHLCVGLYGGDSPGTATYTGADGRYALTTLHAGTYKLSFADCDLFSTDPFAPPSQPPYTVEYWNDKPTLAAATAITVGPGQAAANVDAALTPDAIPQSTITGGPSGTTNQRNAVFSFSSDDPPATFDCSLDGADFALCTSPVTYSGLGDGQHTFSVRAHDATGHRDLTPASQQWTVAAGSQTATVSGTVTAGGTVSSDPLGTGPTPENPVTAAVTTPDGGEVTITSNVSGGSSGGGFQLIGQAVQITAPPASVERPLQLQFEIDGSEIPAGTAIGDITPIRDGSPAGECPGSRQADPDPCVSDRQALAGGGVSITVLTSHASLWTLGRRLCVVPKLKGKTVKQAKKKLADANCALGKAKRKKAKSTKQRGKVISQSKKPGTQLDPGTKIGVVVGK